MDEELSIIIEEEPNIEVEVSVEQIFTTGSNTDNIEIPDLLLIYNIAKV